jgi:hypothetical protein
MNKEQEKLLNIDLLSLDEEWLKQPQIFMEAADKVSDLLHQKDKVKEDLERLTATVDLEIRKNPDKFDIAKVTESAVKSTLILDKRIIKKQEELSDAIYSYNLAVNFVKALEMKKKALEGEVNLFQAQYFAIPKQKIVNADNYNVEKEVEDKSENKQRRKLRRKNK